jgi:hypothetical protein
MLLDRVSKSRKVRCRENKSKENYFPLISFRIFVHFSVYLAIKHKWCFLFFKYRDLMRDFYAVSHENNGERHNFQPKTFSSTLSS